MQPRKGVFTKDSYKILNQKYTSSVALREIYTNYIDNYNKYITNQQKWKAGLMVKLNDLNHVSNAKIKGLIETAKTDIQAAYDANTAATAAAARAARPGATEAQKKAATDAAATANAPSDKAKASLYMLNLALNKDAIPKLNKAIEIFNEPNDNYKDKLTRILAELPDAVVVGGSRNTTRSKGNRSNRKTMKIRFIY